MPIRLPLRLPDFDYARAGAYFVTVCLAPRRPLLGRVVDAAVQLSVLGRIVLDELRAIEGRDSGARLDLAVVMPDHVHGIVLLAGETGTPLSTVVGTFKSSSARLVNARRSTPGEPFWQRGYYDHVIRDDADLDRVRTYIIENPVRWAVAREQAALARNVPDAHHGTGHTLNVHQPP